jgi:hypothetical protein
MALEPAEIEKGMVAIFNRAGDYYGKSQLTEDNAKNYLSRNLNQ